MKKEESFFHALEERNNEVLKLYENFKRLLNIVLQKDNIKQLIVINNK